MLFSFVFFLDNSIIYTLPLKTRRVKSYFQNSDILINHMQRLNNYYEFKQYVLRKLGHPIVDVEINDEQFDDCFDEATEEWNLFSTDGLTREYLRFRLKATELNVTDNEDLVDDPDGTDINEEYWPIERQVKGVKSGVIANVIRDHRKSGHFQADIQTVLNYDEVPDPNNPGETRLIRDDNAVNKLLVRGVRGNFEPGEDVVLLKPDYVGIDFVNKITDRNHEGVERDANNEPIACTLVDKDPVNMGIYDSHSVDIGYDVFGITNVISLHQASASKNIFDLQYQLRLHDLYDLSSTSLIHYKNVLSYLQLLHLELNGHTIHRFNRREGKLHIDVNFSQDITLGDFIIVHGYKMLDPKKYNRAFNDLHLKHLTTALVKKQWGMNIKKFSGVALIGDVIVDGQALYEEGKQEFEDIKQRMRDEEPPLEWFIG